MKLSMIKLLHFISKGTKAHIAWLLLMTSAAALPSLATAASNSLIDFNFAALPGDQVKIRLSLENPSSVPGSFTIDNPARIAFDFPNTKINLPSRTQTIGVGVARSINAVEAGGRTRVVLNLSKLVNYSTELEGNDVIITLGGEQSVNTSLTETSSAADIPDNNNAIKNIDFRRGEQGEGRIILDLADPNTPIDIKARGEKITITARNSAIANELERRLDVIDFGTPVKTIDSFNQSGNVKIIIQGIGEFNHIAYQADDKYTIDVKPIVKETAEEKKKKEFAFKGERLSLNFQNIEVRAVLQLIADFTDLNLITSDTVKGNVTLRLKNVPWDQALDIVLRSKGLAMVKDGNVISVAPAEEVAARAKLDNKIEEQAPLLNETFQINYAKAKDIAPLLKGGKENSVISDRGSVKVDERTNKLLITDTAKNLNAVAGMVRELDIAIRQVLIESRVVIAISTFSKEIGVRFGVTNSQVSGNQTIGIGANGLAADTARQGGQPPVGQRYNVNLPAVASSAGTIGLAIARLPFGTLLDLELSAAQAEGRSETISSPKVITSNANEAVIEAGTEIPYQEASSSGATSVAFKKAVLSLTVTPQITPDDRVIMDLKVTKDQPDFANAVLGVPPIITQKVETQVLVDNGETIVLGGVYEQTKSNTTNRVPFLGDLPFIGALFRSRAEENDKQELLIFVTPKLLSEKVNI